MEDKRRPLKRHAVVDDSGKRDLRADFHPSEFDVICGKGKSCFNHAGNVRFRKFVGLYLPKYSGAKTKIQKSAIVSEIVIAVRRQSPEGGFVKKVPATNTWVEVGDHLAREKVGSTIRDALHSQYRSSTKSKKHRRQAVQAKANANLVKISSTNFEISSKIDNLKLQVEHVDSDRVLSEMFTRANLEILNELNRLRRLRMEATVPSRAAFPQHEQVVETTIGLELEQAEALRQLCLRQEQIPTELLFPVGQQPNMDVDNDSPGHMDVDSDSDKKLSPSFTGYEQV